jgi:hypothetical protein
MPGEKAVQTELTLRKARQSDTIRYGCIRVSSVCLNVLHYPALPLMELSAQLRVCLPGCMFIEPRGDNARDTI